MGGRETQPATGTTGLPRCSRRRRRRGWRPARITSASQLTLPPGLATVQGAPATGWPRRLAGNVMSLVPMLVIFIAARRHCARPVAPAGLAGP